MDGIFTKDEFDKVSGEIYKITNAITNKCYIGQTRSHRLNHGKYRPFGYMGRFKDHVSESKSNKVNTCKYLNSALIKYGAENFTCELLIRCGVCELDKYEQQYIKEFDSKYPNGYNLTDGGQTGGYRKGSKVRVEDAEIVPRHTIEHEDPDWFRQRPHSEETKQRISKGIKLALNTQDHLTEMMKNSQNQHLEKKFETFKDVSIDPNNIEQYLNVKLDKNTNKEYIQIAFDRKRRITFVGKYESIESIKDRARQFLRELINRGNTTKLREVPEAFATTP